MVGWLVVGWLVSGYKRWLVSGYKRLSTAQDRNSGHQQMALHGYPRSKRRRIATTGGSVNWAEYETENFHLREIPQNTPDLHMAPISVNRHLFRAGPGEWGVTA